MGGVYQPTLKDRKTGEKKTFRPGGSTTAAAESRSKRAPNSTREADAWKLLKRRHGEIAEGKPVGPDITRTTFEDLAAMLVNDYKANGRSRSTAAKSAINHLRGGLRRGQSDGYNRRSHHPVRDLSPRRKGGRFNDQRRAGGVGRMFVWLG